MKLTAAIPVYDLPCGCIVATETRVVTFSPTSCVIHTAGRALPPDPNYSEWYEFGSPVG